MAHNPPTFDSLVFALRHIDKRKAKSLCSALADELEASRRIDETSAFIAGFLLGAYCRKSQEAADDS